MATILTKKKDTSGAPVAGDLTNSSGGAELAVNTADKRLYTKDSGGNVVEVGTNPGTAVTFTAGTVSAPAITTTGDTNTGVFFPAADTIAFAEGGAEAMRINSDSQVVTTAGTASLPAITTTGDVNTGIFFPAADTIAFAEGGAEAMRIDSSGTVGVGVTPSAWDTVTAIQIKNASLYGFSTTDTSVGSNNYFGTGNWRYIASSSASQYLQTGGQHIWRAAGSGTAGNAITWSESMRIDSSGNVGIGTTSPNLGGVNKAITLNSAASTNASYELSINGTFIGSMYTNTADSSMRFGTWQNAPMVFLTNSTERMRIDSSGNVGIGGTATSGYKLDIQTSGTSRFSVRDTSSTGVARVVANSVDAFFGNESSTGSVIFQTQTTERARITSGGRLEIASTGNVVTTSETLSVHGITGMGGTGSTTLYRLYVSNAAGSNATSPMIRFSTTDGIAGTIISTTTSTTYATSSDYRLKENIAPMTGALDKVAQLNPVTYNWKSNGSASQGFIAHELQAVCPDAVTGKKDETEIQQIEVSPAVPATYDEDGNELTPAVEATYEEREVPVYQGVDTSFLVATLTAAIQELKAITDAQATRIEALEAQNAAFEARLAALENK